MQFHLKIMMFALTGLFSYGATASLAELTLTVSPNKELSLNEKNLTINQSIKNTKTPNNDPAKDSYSLLPQQIDTDIPVITSESASNIFLAQHGVNTKQEDSVKSSLNQSVDEKNQEVPLPATLWFFLAGLLGFLRIHRNRPTT